MDKQTLINSIALDLVHLYTPFAYDQGADITIEATFTEGKSSAGSAKVSFSASILISEAEGTVYYWEQSKTSKSGLSFNAYDDNASSMVMPKIVTSQIYDPNGNLIEGQLDMHQIGKAVKARAKEQGWTFKTVLQRTKASFPLASIPEGKPTGVQPIAVPANTVIKKTDGGGLFYWLLYSTVTLLALLVGFVGEVSLVGMAVIIGLAAIMLMVGVKGVIKGLVMTFCVWIGMAIVFVFVIGFFAPSSDTIGDTTQQEAGSTNSQQSTSAPVASKDETPMFAITGVRTSAMATAESRVVNGESEYKPFAVFISYLDFKSMGPVGEASTNLKKLRVYNFEVTEAPSKGKVSYFVEYVPQNSDYTAYTSLDAYEQDFDASTYYAEMSITLHMMITDVSDFFALNQTTVSSDEILGKVATWEDLKFTFECDVEAITESGDRYVKHMVFDLPQGDFIFNPTDQSYSEVKVDMVNDMESALFIKQ